MDLRDYKKLQFFNKLEIQQECSLFLNLDTSNLPDQLGNVERLYRHIFTSLRICGRYTQTSL